MRARTVALSLFFCMPTIGLAAQDRTSEPVTAAPPRDMVLARECSDASRTKVATARSVQACIDAVTAADQAGDAAYAPRSVRIWLGDVYMYAAHWQEAISVYQSALIVARPSAGDDSSDLGTGQLLTKIAAGQANLGELSAADKTAEAGFAKVQASMAAHPDQRQQYVTTLHAILIFRSRIKQVQGDAAAAQALQRQAATLEQAK